MEWWLTKRTMLWALAAVTLFAAWNRGISLLYAMTALLLATLVVAHVAPRLAMRGVSAVRRTPASAFAGQDLIISMQVDNQARGARRMLEIVDSIPAAAPDERRPLSFIAHLPGRKQREYRFALRCYKRGVYRLGPLTLRSGFPLGIASYTRTLPDTTAELVVYPETFAIAALPLPAGDNAPRSGWESVTKTGGSEEFFGTREYRHGDSPRRIHWPSTARSGRLIVKEFEARAAVEMTVVLDLAQGAQAGQEAESTLEYAVRIAASAARYALQKGHDVQLVGYGARPHIVHAGRGMGHLGRILDTLARVQAVGTLPYSKAVRAAADYMRDGGTALLLFVDARDGDAHQALALLRARRIRPVCVFIDRETFTDRGTPAPPDNILARQVRAAGAPLYVVHRGDDLPQVFAR